MLAHTGLDSALRQVRKESIESVKRKRPSPFHCLVNAAVWDACLLAALAAERKLDALGNNASNTTRPSRHIRHDSTRSSCSGHPSSDSQPPSPKPLSKVLSLPLDDTGNDEENYAAVRPSTSGSHVSEYNPRTSSGFYSLSRTSSDVSDDEAVIRPRIWQRKRWFG